MKIRKAIASALLLFTVGLMTACSGGDTPPGTPTPDIPPIVAKAGPHQSVFIGTFVRLDGSESTNTNQTGLTYAWTLTKPASSTATLSNPNIVNPTLTVDVEGTYEATLVVTDAQNASAKSAPDTVNVLASKTNPPPVAKIGTTPQSVFTRLPVLLNGSQSSDANKDPLTFSWDLVGPSRSSARLNDASTVAPSFTPDIDGGEYRVTLVVHDGTNPSLPTSVIIHASDKPSPIADIISPNPVFVLPTPGDIKLDGSRSRSQPSGASLDYNWTIASSSFPSLVSGTSISTQSSALLTGIPPNTAGTVDIQLKVTEPNHPGPASNFAIAKVLVTVGPLATIQVSKTEAPTPPLFLTPCSAASPGTCSGTVKAGTKLQFDGSAGGLPNENTNYAYEWSVNKTSFSSDQKPTYTPIIDQLYGFELTVTDKVRPSLRSTQSFTITAKNGPIAVISPPLTSVGWKQQVILNSSDSSGSNLEYEWTLKDPSGVPSTASSPSLSFTAEKVGVYQVTLKVTDKDTRASHSTDTFITANDPPTAVIDLLKSDPPIRCDKVDLSGQNSTDRDGDGIKSYSWMVTTPAGIAATLDTTVPSAPSFKAMQHGKYMVTLTVTDNLGKSHQVTKPFTTRGFDIFNNVGLSPIEKCSTCHGPQVVALANYAANLLKTSVQQTQTPTKIVSGKELSMGGPVTDGTALRTLDRDMGDLSDFLKTSPTSCP